MASPGDVALDLPPVPLFMRRKPYTLVLVVRNEAFKKPVQKVSLQLEFQGCTCIWRALSASASAYATATRSHSLL